MSGYIFGLLLGIPFLGGGIVFLLPGKRPKVWLATGIGGFIFLFSLFLRGDISLTFPWLPLKEFDLSFRIYSFSWFILIFLSLFAFLISLYSWKFMDKKRMGEYYGYLLWTLGASIGVVLSNNLFGLVLFWGMLPLLLYALLSLGSLKWATKGMITLASADFFFILGICLLYFVSGTLRMDEIKKIPLLTPLSILSYILIVIGALAKAGSMPFHTWIPSCAKETPSPVLAYLPASLDKLLGIYLLSRASFDFFKLEPLSALSLLLMFIGSVTIIGAVMLALVQHNFKKLLSYHAVSQVGYMVLGIGTATPVGIAGGIFHMVNNSIYKASLFLGGGAVERQTKTSELEELGGLGGKLPFTFLSFVIASLAISGIPPLNGFFSKWMVYQGVIETGLKGGQSWIIWLLAAMFGSSLTLASFLKLIHSIFLGSSRLEKGRLSRLKEVPFSMILPQVVLASLCIIFGIFALRVPLGLFIFKVVPGVEFLGWWKPELATLLIIAGFIIGGIIYLMGKLLPRARESTPYIGGEALEEGMKISGVDFYDTVRGFPFLSEIYEAVGKGFLDFYGWWIGFLKGLAYLLWGAGDRLVDWLWIGLSKLVLLMGRGASLLHTGNLHTYLSWYLLGIFILFVLFFLF